MPWYIHSIDRLYDPHCRTGLPDGSWPLAVPEPFTAGSIFAAWWVLTGKAFAFVWPKPGDLERSIGLSTRRPSPETAEQKAERNKRLQARYDELMSEGKHGHYETMFRVVREELARAANS